jgi:hypothetical protein
MRLHVLSRHRVVLDDIRQSRGRKVLLAGLFLGAVLSRVLFHGFQSIGLAAILVLSLFEKLARLFTHLQHPVRCQTEHFRYPRHLIVFGRPGK